MNKNPLADRAAVLDRECAADEEPRRRIEALPIVHDTPDRLLDRPFVAGGEQVGAIRVQPIDKADEVKSPRTA